MSVLKGVIAQCCVVAQYAAPGVRPPYQAALKGCPTYCTRMARGFTRLCQVIAQYVAQGFSPASQAALKGCPTYSTQRERVISQYVAQGFRLRIKLPPSLKLRRTAVAQRAEAGRRTVVALAEAVSPASHQARVPLAVLALLCLLTPVAGAQSRPPARIVSLVPSVTEMLFAVGSGPQVVGVSSYDHEPPAVEQLPRVGALIDPDLERILALRPDLVVIYGSQAELAEQLDRARIPMFRYRHGALGDVLDTTLAIGRTTGHAAQAASVVAAIKQRLADVQARVAGRARPRVLLVFGRDPLTLRGIYASGGRGFLHDLIELAGGANVFADIRRESVQASTETILARRPDVILEVRADPLEPPAAARERDAWLPLASVPAVHSRRITLLSGTDLVVPGPRLAQAAERFARALHPEAWR
jgi:iron complex transport system substrate-binding protein